MKRKIARTLASTGNLPRGVRGKVWEAMGLKIHETALIATPADIYSREFTMEEGSFINRNFFSDGGPIIIGKNVSIGPDVIFAGAGHEVGSTDRRAGTPNFGKIEVKEGTWIGARVTVLQDVTIAEGCIIAAGAVVTKSTEPNGLYAGVPARRIKDLD